MKKTKEINLKKAFKSVRKQIESVETAIINQQLAFDEDFYRPRPRIKWQAVKEVLLTVTLLAMAMKYLFFD